MLNRPVRRILAVKDCTSSCTLTDVEVCERRLVFAITLFEQYIERILAATLLQILQSKFRCVHLVLNCKTHEALHLSAVSEV